MVRIAFLALLIAGCGGSSAIPQQHAEDAGTGPLATCNGGADQCACEVDADCTLSIYPRVATSDACFCPSPCAYNPVRTDQASVRESAYQQNCASGGFGAPDGGCSSGSVTCETLQPRCDQGICTAF